MIVNPPSFALALSLDQVVCLSAGVSVLQNEPFSAETKVRVSCCWMGMQTISPHASCSLLPHSISCNLDEW